MVSNRSAFVACLGRVAAAPAARRLPLAIIFLLMTTAVVVSAVPSAPASAATDETVDGDDEAAEGKPITFCAAPLPPFVVTVMPPSPPMPPGPKPDLARLGVQHPSPADAADEVRAEEAAAPSLVGALTPTATPPPAAPPLSVAMAPASEEVAADDGGPEEASSSLNVLAVVPASEAEVLPPPAPWFKRIARVAEANAQYRQRVEASVRPPAEPDEPLAEEQNPTGDFSLEEGLAENADPLGSSSDMAVAAEEEEEAETADGDDGGDDSGDEDDGSSVSRPSRSLLPRGSAGGPMSEAIQAACREGGLDCRISLVPWIRPASQLDSGPCDAVFPVEDRPETRSYMTVSDPVVESRLAFFTLDASFEKVADLTEFTILAKGPSIMAQHAEAAVKGLEKSALVLGPDLTSLIRRIIGLRPTDRVALYGNYHVVTRTMKDVDESVPALGIIPHRDQVFRVGFSRQRVPGPVIEAFNAGLKRIRETRVLQEILDAGDISPLH